MLKNKKFFLTGLVALLFAFVLIACSGNDDTTLDSVDNENNDSSVVTTAPASTDEEQVEIRFTWWGDTERNKRYNAIVDLFVAQNPHITVITEPATWDDYWTRLATQSAGGNAPTLFGMHPQFVSDYALRGVLMDLEPFVNNGIIDVSEIDTPVIDSGRVGGNLYQISQGVTFQGLIANTTILNEHGVTFPSRTQDWTWDEFMSQATIFAEASDGMTWFSTDFSGAWLGFRYFQRQAGGDIFTESGELSITANRLTEWFAMWNGLRDIGAIPDPATTTEDGPLPIEQRLLSTGRVAVRGFPANQLHLYQAQRESDTFDMFRFPTDDNAQQRGEFIEGAYFSISATATPAEAEAAAALISFWVNSEDAIDIFLLEQGVPANNRLSERIMPVLSESQGRAIEFVNSLMPIAETAVSPPLGAGEINGIFSLVAEQVMHGILTPEDAALSFIEQANEVLGRN